MTKDMKTVNWLGEIMVAIKVLIPAAMIVTPVVFLLSSFLLCVEVLQAQGFAVGPDWGGILIGGVFFVAGLTFLGNHYETSARNKLAEKERKKVMEGKLDE